MKVINLWGGPGSGKSTTAAGVFHQLKTLGYNCELVTEFAKQLTWAQRQPELSNQFYVTGKQIHKQHILKDQVDYVITDSPVPLGIFYNNKYHGGSAKFADCVMEIFNSYDNINFFIKRVKEYNPRGRNQTEEEADEISQDIRKFMVDEDIVAYNIDGNQFAVREILEVIKVHERA